MNTRRDELARRRKSQGLSQERLAELLGVDRTTVCRWEAGTADPQPWARLKLADTLDITTGQLAELLGETTCSAVPASDPSTLKAPAVGSGAWHTMTDVERRSFLVKALGVMSLPNVGLDELRHITRALENVRRYMDAEVIAYFEDQITACAASDGARGPKETLPVVLGLIGAIQHSARDVKPNLRRDLFAVGARAAEFTGWLYRDIGQADMAGYWRDRAIEWAQVAGDSTMQGYTLLKKSQAAWDERDAIRMLTLAEAAQNGPWQLPTQVRGEAAQQEARGHAMLGDDFALVERKLAEARELVMGDEPSGGSIVSTHYGPPLLAMQTAICYAEAGRLAQAVEIYDGALSPGVFSRRDYGYFLALKSGTLAMANAPDDAARTGLDAFDIAMATHSLRSLHELSRTGDLLREWGDRPVVQSFLETVSV